MPGHLAHYSDFIEWSAYFEFEYGMYNTNRL